MQYRKHNCIFCGKKFVEPATCWIHQETKCSMRPITPETPAKPVNWQLAEACEDFAIQAEEAGKPELGRVARNFSLVAGGGR